MKKYTVMKQQETDEEFDFDVEQETALVEQKSFGTKIKEVGSKVIHNKWVRRAGAAVALGTVAVVGFALGAHKSKDTDDSDDLEIIDLDDDCVTEVDLDDDVDDEQETEFVEEEVTE